MISALKSAALGAALLGAFAVQSAAADVLILASTDPGHVRGHILEDGDTVTVAEGAYLVFLFENGREEVIYGPAEYTYDAKQQHGSAPADSLIGGISEILARLETETRLGGVRSDSCDLPTSSEHWRNIASAWSDGCHATAADAVSIRLATLEALER